MIAGLLASEASRRPSSRASRKAMAACEKAQDYVSRDMLAVQLEDTEMDHAYYLEKQLRLIEQVGLQNYKQSQIDGAAAA